LSAGEDDVRRFILTRSAALGRLPAVAEIKEAFARYPGEEVDAVLRRLDEVDVIHLAEDGKSVAAAYPFSGAEMLHLVTPHAEGYRPVYAMCAVDALGIPFMLGCDVSIRSRCRHRVVRPGTAPVRRRLLLPQHQLLLLGPTSRRVAGGQAAAAGEAARDRRGFLSGEVLLREQDLAFKSQGEDFA
jgi:hypothetical protein